MIDTAYNYLNEDAIGEVLEEYIEGGKLKREDIFITTKLANIYSRPSDVQLSMRESIRKLRLNYVDLYLYHAPITLQNLGDPENVFPIADGKLAADESVDLCDVWKVMEELVDQGKAKNIGISNFNSQQVDAICKMARIKPAVNQIECHAYFPQHELQAFCEQRGIHIMAYSPIGSPGRGKSPLQQLQKQEKLPVLMEEETVVSLSKKYNKTPAQILLRNLLQRGIIVIPKSVTPTRIVSNIQVYDFELTKEDMDSIAKLNTGERLFKMEFMKGTRGYPFNDVKTAVRAALDSGYRMIDTAYNYLNEDAIGEVLEEYIEGGKLKRKDIFITTKLAGIYSRPSDVQLSMRESLRKLRLDYVDLYLYHGPITFQNLGDPENFFPFADGKLLANETVDFCEVWKVMEELVDQGKAKDIGISNFNSEQVDAISKMARIKPVVNQVECHPYFPQNELQAFCEQRGIRIMAYSPLGSPGRGNSQLKLINPQEKQPVLMKEGIVVLLSKKYDKTPAQVYDFELTKEDMDSIAKLNTGARLFKMDTMKTTRGYPFNIPFY